MTGLAVRWRRRRTAARRVARRHVRAAIVWQLWQYDVAHTVPGLAAATGIRASRITRTVRDLIADGYLVACADSAAYRLVADAKGCEA